MATKTKHTISLGKSNLCAEIREDANGDTELIYERVDVDGSRTRVDLADLTQYELTKIGQWHHRVLVARSR